MTVFSGQTWNMVVELANMQSPGPLPAYKKEKERKKKRRKERKKEVKTTWPKAFCFVKLSFALMFLVIQML